MANDYERREVAERLRAYGKEFGDPTWRELCNVVFFDDDLYPSAVRKLHLIDRLADLIEPSDTSLSCRDTVAPDRGAPETCEHWLDGECYALRTARPVDRRALLALAQSMMVRHSWLSASDAARAKRIADRIREACGEVDA